MIIAERAYTSPIWYTPPKQLASMKEFLREPLLHFLLLAAAIFAVYDVAGKNAGGQPARIVITQGQIASMAEGFGRTWQRPPTTDELEGLIRDRVREEVYCREAVALGLDKDDPIIRRRLRQKLEFVTDDVATQAEPTDGELSAYLKTHPDRFRVERRFTFRQVYLDPERHGENLARDAAQLLARLDQADRGTDVSELGDPFLLEHGFDAVPAGEIAKQFGENFAAKLGDLPLGQWQGPVESGYGVHLVFIGDAHGRARARTGGGARCGPPRMAQRPSTGGEREVLRRNAASVTR